MILLEDFVENSGSKCPLATKEVLEDDTEDETDINEDENDHNVTDPAKDEFNETKVFDKSTMPFLDWEPMEVKHIFTLFFIIQTDIFRGHSILFLCFPFFYLHIFFF